MKTTKQSIYRLGNYWVIVFLIENCLYRASASNGGETYLSNLYTTSAEAVDEIKTQLRENNYKGKNAVIRPN